MDSRTFLTASIIVATLVGAWMFRYEAIEGVPAIHKNRFTGAVCLTTRECWWGHEGSVSLTTHTGEALKH